MVLLPSVAKDEASSRARQIREAVEDPVFMVPNSGIPISISFGISSLDENISSENELVDNALRSLALDKKRGGNRI